MTVKENVAAIANDVVISVTSGKKWYTSKTVWVNVISIVALAVQAKYGFVIPADYQAGALAAVNLVLRKVTKTEITL